MSVFILLIVILLLWSASDDVETNTGPSNDSSRCIYGTHNNTVTWEQSGVVCETCDQRIHIN